MEEVDVFRAYNPLDRETVFLVMTNDCWSYDRTNVDGIFKKERKALRYARLIARKDPDSGVFIREDILH